MDMKKLGIVLTVVGFSQSIYADSLYNPISYRSLTEDHRAYRVGDVLTVLVYEDAVASTQANTRTNKSGSIGGSASGTSTSEKGSAGLSTEFSGGGKIERAGKLTARITVNVKSIYDNGDLQISGRQLVAFNEEKQQIAIEGRIRKVDISPNNTVISSRIADARVSYVGKGILGKKQKQGILTRFLSWLHLI